MNTTYTLHLTKDFTPSEFGQLAALAHWGKVQDFTEEVLHSHFNAADFTAHVRTSGGQMVGYTAALTNGLGGVYVDALLTHPEFDRSEIGRLLLRAVRTHFAGHPIYAMPFVDEQEVFRNEGFTVYRREMIALANRNDVSLETACG